MVIKKTLLKDGIRSFKKNKKRFVSVIFIIALAACFYIGLNSFKNNMELLAKNNYKNSNLFDIKLVSSEGFDLTDKSKIKMIKGVKGVCLYKTLNAKTTINNKDYNLKLNSINIDKNNPDDYINKISLKKGVYPITLNEGLVDDNFLSKNNLNLGDLLIIKLDDDSSLRAKKIKIVGTFKNTSYSNNIEDNKYYVYLDDDNFNLSYYKEGFVTIKGANNYDFFKKDYDNYINKYKNKIDNLMTESTKEKYNYEKEDIEQEINDLKDDIKVLKDDEALGENVSDDIKILEGKLKKLEKQKSNIKKPYYYSIKRSDDKKINDYKLEIERIKNIAKFFPLAFFLAAILISFASILRIVNKEKSYVATLKALGYKNEEVYFKYIIYAVIVGIVGSLCGAILSIIVPKILFNLYKPIYNFESFKGSISIKYIIISLVLSVLSCILGAVFSFIKDLNKKPAELKRPEIYKETKISFIENKLKFINKTTLRNIVLYKKRFIITILSISLVTSLLILSFGINDSFNNSIKKQYDKIIKYNISVSFNNKDKAKALDKIKKDKYVKNKTFINKKEISINDDYDKEIYLITVKNIKKINDFISIKKIDNKGVTISKNLSKKLNLNKNDALSITFDNGKTVKLKINNITNNYTNNYIYISSALYKKKIDKQINYNTMLINYDKNIKKQTKFKNKLSKYNSITSVNLTSSEINGFKNVKKVLKEISNVLIIFSSLLTIIVLYNMASMNITERLKELSIMKSMGFYTEKIVGIMLKEVLILSIIGYILGIIIGSILTLYSINIYNTNNFMFSFKIKLSSYIFTLLIILTFIIIMILKTYLNIRKLNIVKNLKSNE